MRFAALSSEKVSSPAGLVLAIFALASAVSCSSNPGPTDRQTANLAGGMIEPVKRAVVRADAAMTARISHSYDRLPLSFEANRGQTDPRVDFLARGPGYTLFLSPHEVVLSLSLETEDFNSNSAADGPSRTPKRRLAALRMQLVRANPHAKAAATEELPGKVNYLIGNDPTRWRTCIPTYAKATYSNVYPGIDLVYYGNQRQLEYDFVVRAGSSPEAIRLRFEGADRIEIDAQGELVLHVAGRLIRQSKPYIYQLVEGRHRQIPGGYALHRPSEIRFEVSDYDRGRPLVIDPTLVYSTYLGGTGQEGQGQGIGSGITVDTLGSAYVTGTTCSMDFPTAEGAYDATQNGSCDAFVTKLNAAGSDLLYSTFLGGSNNDTGVAIALDASGNAYVTGSTSSANYPTTAGAFDTTYNGTFQDAFVTKLNSTGSALVYSTFLGGAPFNDWGNDITVDSVGSAYVTGATGPNFPTTPGAFDTTHNGSFDAFVTKLNVAGSALAYSTYLGGTLTDNGHGIAVDAAGSAYVTGITDRGDYPTTPGAFDPTFNGVSDIFVTKLNIAGSALSYSTFLGGSDQEGTALVGTTANVSRGIVVDAAGSAYVSSDTRSTNYPTTPGAFDPTYNGGVDGIVTSLNPAGSALVYSTYLGGNGDDSGFSIALDSAGDAYVTGQTSSLNFPTTPGAFDSTYNGAVDAFVTKLNATGAGLVDSTYLGGILDDIGRGIAVDASSSAYATGYTSSADFPTSPNSFDTTYNGGRDVFVVKIADVGPPATLTLDPPAATNPVDSQHCVTATVKDVAGNPVPDVTVRFTVTGAVNTSGSAVTDADGKATFCYTGPPLPGEDAITAYADTDEDNVQDPGEPSGAATKTWVLPVTTPLCEIIIANGGWIIAANGDRASFGGNAQSDENGDTQGQEEYQDHGPAQPFNMHSINVLAIVCEGTTAASIYGQATIDGSGEYTYRIRVQDLAEPGNGMDTYWILLQTSYTSGEQKLEGGNIQIRRE